ncbi:GNAT family protein [Actinopolymorpha sp. B17G11]|uniref:GNAT family N-acetyltransferase n=1 Tax=Actinopolymorpha sp. B17G11 TaxID=3160861 RepID=UPI0032E412F0
MHPVRLVGETVVLREFRIDDLDDAVAVVGDDRVTNWLSFDSRSRTETDAMIRGIIERSSATPRTEYYLAVALPADDHLVGFARLAPTGVKAGKLGYAIAADHWRRGYATDAVRTLVAFAFEALGLHRISAAIGPDNKASMAIVETLGFVREGQIRDHVFTNGAWRDSVLYSLLADEWERIGTDLPADSAT